MRRALFPSRNAGVNALWWLTGIPLVLALVWLMCMCCVVAVYVPAKLLIRL